MAADRFRLIAFYLPQYHPIPENDSWWGKGFTEWTSVAKAKPLFRGHYQPHLPADLGFYDLRLSEARSAQAQLAREHGIYGFCYYHYWFNGKLLLERPFNDVLASGQPDFPFCLCWANENWTRAWDGLEHDILIAQRYHVEDDRRHIHWLIEAFRDRRYIRVDGKPLLLVYRVSNLPDPLQTASLWREEAHRAGIGELYLATVESLLNDRIDPIRIGFDAAVEFQPDWSNLGFSWRRLGFPWRRLDRTVRIYDYPSIINKALQKAKPQYRRFPCVTPAWDNTPRRIQNAVVFSGSTPEFYQGWLTQILENFTPASPEENLVFVNAWNEWGEGAHLEPCQKWGRAYLEATRKALQGASVVPHVSEAVGSTLASVSNPRISVCIPTYNGGRYVREAIASVLRQTFTDFELIVLDDCSSDQTVAEIQSLRDPRMRLVQNPSRLGLVGNWNRCFELSRAKYVCIFHQDDVMLPTNLEAKIKVLDEAPNVGMVHSNVFQIDSGGNVLSDWWYFKPKKEENGIHAGSVYFKTLLLGPNIVCCPSVIVRKECYEKLGGFDAQLPFTADWEIWMRIALFYDVGYLIEPLVQYRQHANMETANFAGVKELEHALGAKKAVLQKYANRIPNAELLTMQTADMMEKEAVGRALQCRQKSQHALAREYFSFAAKVHENLTVTSSLVATNDAALQITDESESEHFRGHSRNEMEWNGKSGLQNDNPSFSKDAACYLQNSRQNCGEPSVSVIICLGANLDRAVQSVLDQRYENFEILIVDDGTSEPVIQHMAASFQRPKTRILRTKDQGLANAKNLGTQEAKGCYIAFIGANCLVEPGFLQRAVEALENDPAIAFASCWVRGFGENQLTWNSTSFEFPHLLVNNAACASAFVRRDAVVEIGGFDPEISAAGYENWDLAITFVESGKRGMVIPEYLLSYSGQQGAINGYCTQPVDHVLLTRYLVDKHGCSYKRYFPGVLGAIEKRTLELERSKPGIGSNTPPEVAQRVTYLENALRSVLQSRNWRLTHPLRRSFAQLQRFRKSLAQANRAKPRISVIVNCGRDGWDLRKSLESICFLLNGTGEVLVIDDGATDPITREMIDWYYDSGVEVLRMHGVTSTRAREAGLRQARAPILFALNAGDVVAPSTFLRAMEILESHEHIAYVCCGLRDETSRFTWMPESVDLPGLLACPRVVFPMVKRKALLQIQGYDATFSQPLQADWDLTLRLAAHSVQGMVLAEAIVQRVNAGVSHSSMTTDESWKASLIRQVVDKHRALFDDYWLQTVLGQENLMRKLEAHLQEFENPTSVSSLSETID